VRNSCFEHVEALHGVQPMSQSENYDAALYQLCLPSRKVGVRIVVQYVYALGES
jgi:hypothetical protein